MSHRRWDDCQGFEAVCGSVLSEGDHSGPCPVAPIQSVPCSITISHVRQRKDENIGADSFMHLNHFDYVFYFTFPSLWTQSKPLILGNHGADSSIGTGYAVLPVLLLLGFTDALDMQVPPFTLRLFITYAVRPSFLVRHILSLAERALPLSRAKDYPSSSVRSYRTK
jgi:hypothetical protein